MLINGVSGRKKYIPRKVQERGLWFSAFEIMNFSQKPQCLPFDFVSFLSQNLFSIFFFYIMPNKILYYHRPPLPQMLIQFRDGNTNTHYQ